MKKIYLHIAMLIFLSTVICQIVHAGNDVIAQKGSKDSAAITMSTKSTLSPNTDDTKRIILRNKLEHEGDFLARQGLYNDAIKKFNEAMKPEYLNKDSDKSSAQMRTVWAHKRQGRFELALKEHTEWLYSKFSTHEFTVLEHLELLAFVKTLAIKNNTPIYDHINYLKTKYAKFLPPDGYVVGFSSILIDKFIQLYDYLHDYNAGIVFIDELIIYFTQKGYLSSNSGKKIVKEYTRVKQAWELDKKTGQHGHLKEVIKTSDIIGW